ncbi:hypothetical protein ACFVAJ_06655 [Agromyces sp. NPDC057679]|uniref:hypothetical protein n=1 Tax=Agromyces sp. NPDC057679 TaxID=3346207 RepID=UPI00367044D2
MDRVIVAVVIVAGFIALAFAGPDGPSAEQAVTGEPVVGTTIEAAQDVPAGAMTADTAERLALAASR